MADAPISPVGGQRPKLHFNRGDAIHNEPVELDGTALSPESIKARGAKGRLGSVQLPDNPFAAATSEAVGQLDKQDLATLISTRKSDPAVLVEIPQTPQAEELSIAEATNVAGQNESTQ